MPRRTAIWETYYVKSEDLVRLSVATKMLLPSNLKIPGCIITSRERITTSPLCDAPAYAHSVEAAYREMWRKWCADPNPPKRETEINARPYM